MTTKTIPHLLCLGVGDFDRRDAEDVENFSMTYDEVRKRFPQTEGKVVYFHKREGDEEAIAFGNVVIYPIASFALDLNDEMIDGGFFDEYWITHINIKIEDISPSEEK